MKSRQLWITGFAAAAVLTISGLLPADEFKPYQSLLPMGSQEPSSHIIVRVDPNRQAPDDWDMQWFVATYTPKGLRLPLGVIHDGEAITREGTLTFEVPAGEYRVEITRRPGEWFIKRIFNVDRGVFE